MANDMTDAERMAKYETQMENLITVVTRMDTKIDAWQANFVSKELLDEKLKARDRENERLSDEVERLEKEKAEKEDIRRIEKEKTSFKNNMPFWVSTLLAGIALLYDFWPKK
jgi:hypothetical protein